MLNGIDMVRYDPNKDPDVPHHYSAGRMTGKAKCKAKLQEQMGLAVNADIPVIGIVSRLVGHKGLDLIRQVFDQIMELNCQFIVLGSGDAQYEQFFEEKRAQYDGRMAIYRGYNEPLAMQIYAMTRKRISPEVNALSTILFVVVLTLLVIVNVRQVRQEQLNEKRARALRKGGN